MMSLMSGRPRRSRVILQECRHRFVAREQARAGRNGVVRHTRPPFSLPRPWEPFRRTKLVLGDSRPRHSCGDPLVVPSGASLIRRCHVPEQARENPKAGERPRTDGAQPVDALPEGQLRHLSKAAQNLGALRRLARDRGRGLAKKADLNGPSADAEIHHACRDATESLEQIA